MTNQEHEKAAKDFVAKWEQHLLALIALSAPEATKQLFEARNKLVDDLRSLLREERERGYYDAKRELADKIKAVL